MNSKFYKNNIQNTVQSKHKDKNSSLLPELYLSSFIRLWQKCLEHNSDKQSRIFLTDYGPCCTSQSDFLQVPSFSMIKSVKVIFKFGIMESWREGYLQILDYGVFWVHFLEWIVWSNISHLFSKSIKFLRKITFKPVTKILII